MKLLTRAVPAAAAVLVLAAPGRLLVRLADGQLG